MRGTHSSNNCKMQGLVFKLTTTSVVEKLILTENFLDRSQLDAYTMSKLWKMMVWPKIEKQMRNKRNRSCYAITDDTKIWAITINYHHQTFSHCLAAFKELHLKKKCWVSFLPHCPTVWFSLFICLSSISPTMQKTQSVSHPLDHPFLFLQASQVGQQFPRPTCRWHSRGLRHQAEQEGPCAPKFTSHSGAVPSRVN